jgi:hypothetical protein
MEAMQSIGQCMALNVIGIPPRDLPTPSPLNPPPSPASPSRPKRPWRARQPSRAGPNYLMLAVETLHENFSPPALLTPPAPARQPPGDMRGGETLPTCYLSSRRRSCSYYSTSVIHSSDRASCREGPEFGAWRTGGHGILTAADLFLLDSSAARASWLAFASRPL